LETLAEISFSSHFSDREVERGISIDIIRKQLRKGKLIQAEEQQAKKPGERKLRLRFELSNRFDLVLITVFINQKARVITCWKTNRKWQKKMQKRR